MRMPVNDGRNTHSKSVDSQGCLETLGRGIGRGDGVHRANWELIIIEAKVRNTLMDPCESNINQLTPQLERYPDPA